VSKQRQQRVNKASTEHQQSMNDFLCCILYNPRVVLLRLPIIKVLAAFRGNMVSVNVTTPEDERQQSVNNLGCCILYNPRAVLWHLPIINVMAAVMMKRDCDMVSVSNGSGPSLRVRVRVQTEPLPNWRFGSLINPNCPLGYGFMVNSQPV